MIHRKKDGIKKLGGFLSSRVDYSSGCHDMFRITFKQKLWYIGMTSLQALDCISILVPEEATTTFQALLRGRTRKVLQPAE